MENIPIACASDSVEKIITYIQGIISECYKRGASDVFLAAGAKPSCRILGKVHFLDALPETESDLLEKYLETIASEQERKNLQSLNDLDFATEIEGVCRFRVNVFAQMGGISIVFRTIPMEVPDFDTLHLPPQLLNMVNYKNGLVLLAGSMGHGKTTTLASIIDRINQSHKKHIVTIEDPVEFLYQNKMSLIEQRELDVHTSSFAAAIRSCLRQGADVILLGEMRDPETTAMALRAAEAGALVFSTIHTNGATKSVNRIIDMFPGDEQNQIRVQLAESLRAVVWQALIPTIDGQGRVPACEVLFNNVGIANLIRESKTHQLESALEMGVNEGMITMRKYITALVQKGYVNQEDVEGYLSL